jgi:hypothetical protein
MGSRCTLRDPDAGQKLGPHRDSDPHPRARHRSEVSNLQRGECGVAAAAAGAGTGPARHHPHEERKVKRYRGAARLGRVHYVEAEHPPLRICGRRPRQESRSWSSASVGKFPPDSRRSSGARPELPRGGGPARGGEDGSALELVLAIRIRRRPARTWGDGERGRHPLQRRRGTAAGVPLRRPSGGWVCTYRAEPNTREWLSVDLYARLKPGSRWNRPTR